MTFVIYLVACAAAAATGILFKPGAWYDGLRKPGFTPPRWVFPVAWTLLYLLIAAGGARLAGLQTAGTAIAGATTGGTGMALALWSAQIALNTLWTPVFFGAHKTGLGLIILVLLWLTVAVLIVVALPLDLLAGLLFVPYLAWLSLAGALNFFIWKDNPATV